MFGYAADETPEYMPAPLGYSHKILETLRDARITGLIPFLGVDAKSQVSLRYENGIPVGIEAIVVSTQHHESVDTAEIRRAIEPLVMSVFPKEWHCPKDRFYVNPTGRFVIGGPDGDAGLTGRKIIVDTYGGASPHGGGAFSGKDPSKVDRSGAYMARYLAKNIVASGLAKRCTLQLSYAIGVAQPLSIYVHTHQTSKIEPELIVRHIRGNIDLTPTGIRTTLDLNRPIYQKTSYFGHFGRINDADNSFPWESLNLVPLFQELSLENVA
jgi:S-adenosylmethionine synthetase